jgi:pyruvate formate lyase activating enzyme
MPSPTGIVFDLQRASLDDGPGIRTTVFLKGCPLHCTWCHNPESQKPGPELAFDAAVCTSCQACVTACASGVHTFDATGRHTVGFDRCIAAGACLTACPSGALRLYGGEQSVEAVMAEVVKDRAFYTASGGGLTISGGEPTLQIEFCLALLQAAKAAGISTCVETCGFAPRESYGALLPLTDLFLFDYKATNPELHAQLTGSSNALVLANLRWLHAQGAAVRLRCPLVPGVNDDADHLRAVAALSTELTGLHGVEILPYHESGTGKYERLGRARPPFAAMVPDSAVLARWRETLSAHGCRLSPGTTDRQPDISASP